VEEIFEARVPKTEGILSEVDGQVKAIARDSAKVVKIMILDNDQKEHEYSVPTNATLKVKEGDLVSVGGMLCEGHIDLGNSLLSWDKKRYTGTSFERLNL
jgi:hypothetical protein